MVAKEFKESLSKALRERIGAEVDIRITDVTKNNGVVMTGLTITKEKEGVSPCIYLEDIFARYMNDSISMSDIVTEILNILEKNYLEVDIEYIFDKNFSKVSSRVFGCLVNTEKNREILKHMPHRQFHDLSLVYAVEVTLPGKREKGAFKIKDTHMGIWGIEESELYSIVKEKIESAEVCLEGIMDVISKLAGMEKPDALEAGNAVENMYVLSNEQKLFGSNQLLNAKALENIANMMGDYYILPSSIHELIVIPVNKTTDDSEELLQMVKEVNDTQVPEEEVLSYNIYRFDATKKELELIVA